MSALDKRYMRKSGEVLWAHTSASLLRDTEGGPLCTLAMVQDINERQRAEEALRLTQLSVDSSQDLIHWSETFPIEVMVNHVESGGREYNFSFGRGITERKRISGRSERRPLPSPGRYSPSPAGKCSSRRSSA